MRILISPLFLLVTFGLFAIMPACGGGTSDSGGGGDVTTISGTYPPDVVISSPTAILATPTSISRKSVFKDMEADSDFLANHGDVSQFVSP